mgnify:FL=1
MSGRVLDDLDLEPEPDGASVEALVAGIAADDPERQAREADFAAQFVASGDVGDVRGGDEYPDEQAEGVNDDTAFAAADLVAGVVANLFGESGGGDGLGIEDRSAGPGVVTALGSGEVVELLMDGVPGAVVGPADEALVQGGSGWELKWEVAPLAAGSGLVEDGVDDESAFVNEGSASSMVVRASKRSPMVAHYSSVRSEG